MRILLIDDDADITELIATTLEATSGGDVVGRARDPRTAVRLARELRPDVVVTDLVSSDVDGQYLAALRAAAPEARIVVFSGKVRKVKDPLPTGVDDYVTKGGDLRNLLRAISGS